MLDRRCETLRETSPSGLIEEKGMSKSPSMTPGTMLLEDEELRVGATLTKWVRQRLPTNPQARRQLFLQVVNGLRLQVSQECRHLRRLHMGLEQMYCMGEGAAYSVGTLETMDDLPQDARDLVDQVIMNIGNDARGQTVLDMLQGQASSSASSSSSPATGSLLQECDALRRWLNGAFEGSLSTLMEDQQDLEELGVLPTRDWWGIKAVLLTGWAWTVWRRT